MSQRTDLLETLKTEMATISGTGVYETDIQQIERGLYLEDDFKFYPGAAIICREDEMEQNSQGNSKLRYLHISIYGYCRNDGLTGIDEIHNFADDVEYFLELDWTYKDDVDLGTTVVHEGGIKEPVSIFRLDFKLKYMQILQ